jgi:hypothetical protein
MGGVWLSRFDESEKWFQSQIDIPRPGIMGGMSLFSARSPSPPLPSPHHDPLSSLPESTVVFFCPTLSLQHRIQSKKRWEVKEEPEVLTDYSHGVRDSCGSQYQEESEFKISSSPSFTSFASMPQCDDNFSFSLLSSFASHWQSWDGFVSNLCERGHMDPEAGAVNLVLRQPQSSVRRSLRRREVTP